MPLGLPVDELDAGLAGNPNRGGTRETMFGLDDGWARRLALEKHRRASVSGKQYFLVCPGPGIGEAGVPLRSASAYAPGWVDNMKSLKGKQSTTNACNRTAYKLFWVLARPGEHRDAALAER